MTNEEPAPRAGPRCYSAPPEQLLAERQAQLGRIRDIAGVGD